jgi:predicted HTH domain antitoxin
MYTDKDFVYTMKTMTLSLRLDSEEVKMLDEAANRDGLDRSSLLKRLMRRGYADYRLEAACAAYRHGDVTLSRAAEMAGISLYDLLSRLPGAGLQMNLSADDLRRELAS